jgi:hypothetical protein
VTGCKFNTAVHPRGRQGNCPATNPAQAFFAFGTVSMVNPLLKEGAGTGLVFFCFGFLSSLPRRLLPFAISFSYAVIESINIRAFEIRCISFFDGYGRI